MGNRVNIKNTEPQAYKAMYALEGYLATTQLTKTQKELVKIRASQINRCAYCLDMHTREALKNGETAQRISLLNAWQETGLFTEEEKVILAITEEVTLIHNHGLSDETYKKAEQFFDKNHIAQIIMVVVTINAWNRIAVSTKMEFEIKNDASFTDESSLTPLRAN
jgi:AhpD family alkylhydroperoxidase